jgi:hypothetical protein
MSTALFALIPRTFAVLDASTVTAVFLRRLHFSYLTQQSSFFASISSVVR